MKIDEVATFQVAYYNLASPDKECGKPEAEIINYA